MSDTLAVKGVTVGFQNFSYKHYERIIERHREQIVDYSDCLKSGKTLESFAVVRHDVEFSVDRALRLAYVENGLGVSSTYLFQSCGSAYNVASMREVDRIRTIASLGHKVGLHFYLPDDFDLSNLEQEIMRQRYILERGMGLSVDRFSWHRPVPQCLEIRDDIVFGLINVYGDTFFEYSNEPQRIKYIADSRHRFDYGCPLNCSLSGRKQLLFHPDEWSESGQETNVENFLILLEEAKTDLRNVIEQESPYLAREGRSIENSNIRH